MNIEEAVEALWQSTQTGQYPPQGLQKALTLADAYHVQFGVLRRRIAAGEKQAGWKVGLSADAARKMFGLDAPVCASLLESRRFPSGQTFQHGAIGKPIIESELCLILGKSLKGPGVTREQALAAVAAVAPALEVVDMRLNMTEDMPLGVADGVAQWGYVTGAVITPYPVDLNLGEITAEMKKNGDTVYQVRGRDVIDDQIQTIAWLANHLAEYGCSLEAGQCIMTGSFTKPTPIAKGDTWETTFSGVGTVSASFV